MNLKLINDDDNIMNIKLNRYESNQHVEEDTRNGIYFIQECYKLFIKDNNRYIRDFIKSSYDIHVYIEFDEDRYKRFYSPSIEIKDDYIMVEKLKQYTF